MLNIPPPFFAPYFAITNAELLSEWGLPRWSEHVAAARSQLLLEAVLMEPARPLREVMEAPFPGHTIPGHNYRRGTWLAQALAANTIAAERAGEILAQRGL